MDLGFSGGIDLDDVMIYYSSGLMYFNTNINGPCPVMSDGEILIASPDGVRIVAKDATIESPIYGVCGVCYGACEYVYYKENAFIQYECECANSTDEHIFVEPMLTTVYGATNIRRMEYKKEDIYIFAKDNRVLTDEVCEEIILAMEKSFN